MFDSITEMQSTAAFKLLFEHFYEKVSVMHYWKGGKEATRYSWKPKVEKNKTQNKGTKSWSSISSLPHDTETGVSCGGPCILFQTLRWDSEQLIHRCQAGDRSLDHLECTSALTTLFALFKNGRTALLCWSGFEVAMRYECVSLNLTDKLVSVFLFKNWTCQTCLPEICTSFKLQTY